MLEEGRENFFENGSYDSVWADIHTESNPQALGYLGPETLRKHKENQKSKVKKNKDQPFFLYVAHPQPHVPLFVSEDFTNITGKGLYADVVTEIDYSVGRNITYLEENDLSDRYRTHCDPRLNANQAIELAFLIADELINK